MAKPRPGRRQVGMHDPRGIGAHDVKEGDRLEQSVHRNPAACDLETTAPREASGIRQTFRPLRPLRP